MLSESSGTPGMYEHVSSLEYLVPDIFVGV